MAFEAFIGWRYLFRRNRRHSMWVLFGIALVVTLAAGALFLTLTARALPGHAAPIAPVVAVVFGALFAIVFGLLIFFSVFTTVSIVGVMVGVAALMVVLSVVSGFQEEFKQKVLGVNAHILVMKWGPDFSEYGELEKKLGAMPGVVGVEPFVFRDMLAARGSTQASVALKGIDPQKSSRVLDVSAQMVEGSVESLRKSEGGILIGRALADKLRARVGDTIEILSPLSSIRSAQSGPFHVVGIFDAGFDEYDRRMVYVNLRDAQQLLGREGVASGVELKLDDPNRAPAFARTLERTLKEPYQVIDWERLNHNLFATLSLQKVMVSLFLTIIIVVAAFNIVAALTMIVLSKRREIAILKAMGATSGGIARVFQVAGLTIGAFGVGAGIAFGGLMCGVAHRYGYPLDPKIYMIARLPVHVRPLEVAVMAVVTLAICLLATIYPSLRASALRPVDGLRYQ